MVYKGLLNTFKRMVSFFYSILFLIIAYIRFLPLWVGCLRSVFVMKHPSWDKAATKVTGWIREIHYESSVFKQKMEQVFLYENSVCHMEEELQEAYLSCSYGLCSSKIISLLISKTDLCPTVKPFPFSAFDLGRSNNLMEYTPQGQNVYM